MGTVDELADLLTFGVAQIIEAAPDGVGARALERERGVSGERRTLLVLVPVAQCRTDAGDDGGAVVVA